MNSIRPSKSVRSIDRAVGILKSLHDGGESLTDISHTLNLYKPTVHRLLKALEASKLVVQDPVTRQYYLGPLVFNLISNNISAHQVLIVYAYEDMKCLADISRETVGLEIQLGTQAMCLEEIVCNEELRFTLGRGAVLPLYAGAGGKVILSQLPENTLQMILHNITLASSARSTIIDVRALIAEVEMVRKQGYSTSVEERLRGGAAIAVPINNYVFATALTIVGPDNRFGSKMLDFLAEMKERADRISRRLANLA